MKISISIIIAASALSLSTAKGLAQTTVNRDSTRKVLQNLFISKDPQDKVTLNDNLKKLAASDNEREVMLAGDYYYQLKNQKAADSLYQRQLVKFPMGMAAREKGQQAIYDLKTAEEQEAAYKKWVAKFPPSRFPNIDHDHLVYDYVTVGIAMLYAEKHNTRKALAYINMEKEEFWKTNGYSGLADAFEKAGDKPNAKLYVKKAMDIAGKFYYAKNNDNAGKFAASGYPALLARYAQILFDEKKYTEALTYIEKSYKLNKEVNPATSYSYAKMLMKLGRNKDAYSKLEGVVKAGKATTEMEATFKSLYVKVNGSNKGYDAYAAVIRKGFLDNLQAKLANEIMNTPANNFTLSDLDGNKVTLADLKGKIVILDFWATWCGPCKASFPAMQMAQNKFKDDPNVKFLFIHTWERTPNATEDAKAFIKSKGYNFEVLMDLKDPATKLNNVVSSYNVDGIPSKFVIDKNGIIRFHLLGFEGGNEAAVDELSMMIDMAKEKS
ncbi:redoxin domain-containing protein [Mucilaginibacter sp. KACC 22773]|uniref:redoxin domain-containing protein n=1 Tax=Mucilaginibacter sp. KACC 22773 TaxID=3025671 RepID=UPI0023653002|nr:redoxin domain-containing protein [Mucilaginibacter sp. KACC 22773]WDF77172.1 redoxin domain-containing protein [Mucilaginibacter sp. KACC 22773]